MSLYKQMFDTSPDAQLLVNREGLIQEANKPAQTLFGYGYEELVGQPVEMLIPQRFSANHHHHRENYQKKPRTRPMGIGMSLFGLHKNGSEIPVAAPQGSVTHLSQKLNDASHDIDTAKIDEIRQAIADGKLEINPEKIADRLIESLRDIKPHDPSKPV